MGDIDYSIEGIEKLVKFDGTVTNVDISRLTAPGDNYISLVLRVDFEVEKDGVSKTVSTVAKCIPSENTKKMGNFHAKAMTNEIKWYLDILQLIKDFATEQGIRGMDFFPKYFTSRYSLNPERTEADQDSFLLLENLIPQGFINEDRYEGFDLEATKAILKRMAIFHAVPLAIKFTKPELFKVLKDFMDSNVPKAGSPGADKLEPPPNAPGGKEFKDIILNAIKNIPECSPYTDRFNSVVDKQKGPFSWYLTGPEPWNTMLHNDFWINNMMISPREGEEPLVKLIDFQMCTYGSYAKDLIFFILTSVNTDVAKKYMDDILWFYYKEFTSVLTNVNVDFDLTFTAFLKEVQRVTNESEICHVLFFLMAVFGKKMTGDHAEVEEFNPMAILSEMMQNMSPQLKDKLILIVTESANRNWI